MKKLLLFMLISLSLFACKNRNSNSNTEVDSKTLVAYFSATGTTAAVAEKLANVADADLFEIAPTSLYTAEDLDWNNANSRSTIEMKDSLNRPAMIHKLDSLSNYDTILIGFPIWWGTAPRIINSFIETYDLTGKTVALFATSGSTGIEGLDSEFHKKYPQLTWKSGKLLNNATPEDCASFVELVNTEVWD